MIIIDPIISKLKDLGLDQYNALKLALRARIEGRKNVYKAFAGRFDTVEDLVDYFPDWWEESLKIIGIFVMPISWKIGYAAGSCTSPAATDTYLPLDWLSIGIR